MNVLKGILILSCLIGAYYSLDLGPFIPTLIIRDCKGEINASPDFQTIVCARKENASLDIYQFNKETQGYDLLSSNGGRDLSNFRLSENTLIFAYI